MKHLVVGILAHVDAGKTTLSEAMLYLGGALRSLGRVDHADAFLDTHELERERGITGASPTPSTGSVGKAGSISRPSSAYVVLKQQGRRYM